MTGVGVLGGTGSAEFTIPELVGLVDSGQVRIPNFQRSYVWDTDDVLDLFDSLYRGFPLGTMLLWRRSAPAGAAQFGPISLEVSEQTEALWVVDGQQRLTSLYGSLAPSTAGIDERFEIYLNLDTEKFSASTRGGSERRMLPVRVALTSRTLNFWLREHSADLKTEDFDAADKLVGVIRDYKIPAYIVAATRQDILREVFDRVNSSGKPITRAQIFHALFASETDSGSPGTVVKQLERYGFGSIDENRIVQSLLAIRGGNVQRDLHDEFEADEEPIEWYDHTELALGRVIDFLRSEGVVHLALMPNTLPLPVLAAFFHLHPEPHPRVRRLLSRWLWRGWVHEFGREGGQTPIMRRAITSINPRKLHPEEAPDPYSAVLTLLSYVPDADPRSLQVENFRTDSAAGRLILLALAALNPRESDGSMVDFTSRFEKLGLDKAVTEFVREKRSDAAARGFWSVGKQFSGLESADILASHAITAAAAEAFAHKRADEFIAHRRREIEKLTRAFLRGRLEVGASDRPPLDSMLISDGQEGQ